MKKINYFLFSLLALFMLSSTAFAVDIQGCSIDAEIDVKIANAVHTIILIVQIVVPVLIVIFGSIDFVKAVVAQKEDEIKKGQQTFIKRLIAGVLVFFIVVVVKLVVSFAAGDQVGANGEATKDTIINCANCFLNGADAQTGVCAD